MTSPRVVRTDRYGFIIPESVRKLGDGSTPVGGEGRGAASDSSPDGKDVELAASRPHEGPPPSTFSGVAMRSTEFSATPLSEKDRKERRAKMMLENLRIKKWTDMFSKWDT